MGDDKIVYCPVLQLLYVTQTSANCLNRSAGFHANLYL